MNACRRRVAICVPTFRRPRGLARLLEGLNGLVFEDDPPQIEIVIVDNDADRTAASICEETRAKLLWPLQYLVEARRGIPFARNACVAYALDSADLLAFIDDDEIPEPNWLEELLRVMQTYDADVVTGPVVRSFERDPPAWIRKGRFFEDDRRPTGRQLDRAFTGNVLCRSRIFEEGAPPFDHRLAMTGGEDSHLFQRLHRAGRKIIWADKAVVHEWVPTSRMTATWLVRRSFRLGASLAFIQRDSGTRRAAIVPVGIFWIGLGLLLLPLSVLQGRCAAVRGMRLIAYGAAKVVGAFGARYEEYRTIHGD